MKKAYIILVIVTAFLLVAGGCTTEPETTTITETKMQSTTVVSTTTLSAVTIISTMTKTETFTKANSQTETANLSTTNETPSINIEVKYASDDEELYVTARRFTSTLKSDKVAISGIIEGLYSRPADGFQLQVDCQFYDSKGILLSTSTKQFSFPANGTAGDLYVAEFEYLTDHPSEVSKCILLVTLLYIK
jgi:uncharacterized protein YcfL